MTHKHELRVYIFVDSKACKSMLSMASPTLIRNQSLPTMHFKWGHQPNCIHSDVFYKDPRFFCDMFLHRSTILYRP